LLHKPVWQHAKCIRQSLSSQSEIGDILILMQKSGILLIRNEKWSKVIQKIIFGSDTKNSKWKQVTFYFKAKFFYFSSRFEAKTT
jgi:hypothetical protein